MKTICFLSIILLFANCTETQDSKAATTRDSVSFITTLDIANASKLTYELDPKKIALYHANTIFDEKDVGFELELGPTN